MAAYPSSSSSFMPLSGSTGGNMLKTMPMPMPMSTGVNIDTNSSRVKLSKALPAPPPALDKPVPDPTASRSFNQSYSTADGTPDLPPLPRNSSSSSPALAAFAVAASNSYHAAQPSSAIPTKKPVPPVRKMPGTMTSTRPPASSTLPQLPPPPPEKTVQITYQQNTYQQQQQQQQPMRIDQPRVPPKNSVQPGPTSPSSQGPIRRRPVGNSSSSATGNDLDKSPRLPDLPSFDSFGSFSNLPSQSEQPAFTLPTTTVFSPQTRDYADAASETQSQTNTVRPSHAEKEEQESSTRDTSARVTSISSILSAYSQDSSAPPGLSSSNSDGTISTNTSSYMSQEKNLPVPLSPGLDENEQSALSYLLDGYTDDDAADSLTSAMASPTSLTAPSLASPTSSKVQEDEYDPYSNDAYYSYQHLTTRVKIGDDDNSAVSDTTAALPPRSTSVARPVNGDATTPIQTSGAPASELFRRRSGGAPINLSISELRLKPTSASADTPNSVDVSGTSAAAAAASSTAAHAARAADAGVLYQRSPSQPQPRAQPPKQAEEERTQAPVAPSKDEGYAPFRPPSNPPPQSPLPTLPPKADLDQPRPRSKSPPRKPALSLGLPGRNIRPSRQNSPATTPATTPRATTPKAGPRLDIASAVAGAAAYANADSPSSATMGTGLSKLEAKISSSVKRKEIPTKAQTQTQAKPQAQPQPQSQPSPQRLPTPEYDNDDKERSRQQAASTETGTSFPPNNGDGVGRVSVVSAALSIAASRSSSATAVNAPALPEAPASKSPAESITPTGAPAPIAKDGANGYSSSLPKPAAFGLVGRDIRPVKKETQQALPQAIQVEQSAQGAPQPQQQQFAPRTSSRNVPAPAPYPNPYANGSESASAETSSQITIRPASEKAPEILYGGQQQQQREHQRQLSSRGANDGSALAPGMPPAFPSYTVTEPGVNGRSSAPLVVTPDTVFTAPPPSLTHFNCMQGHRGMFRDLNINYPLSCQTCQTFERSVRWRCKWCYVRICTGCRDVLHTHANHDLAKLMQFIKNPESLPLQTGGTGPYYEADGRMRSRGGSSTDLPVIREA
ncbi:hypothetical protein F503_05385 [Ophiostoma piceae UAMH 11346]|uniref:Uncharacterized protein n=1 Tax=Ophiostoma piceae (strain UAMH 11346) TaxID=1262450 RepID=S3D9W6_OPHP1|nr:hypothetical protein F503_05385 [Ophiostoma piceae UAMH 11346]